MGGGLLPLTPALSPAKPGEREKIRSSLRFQLRQQCSLVVAAILREGLIRIEGLSEAELGARIGEAEANLVAEQLRLVIELDGAYYHLNDRVAYRRDRRKDWEYQRYGGSTESSHRIINRSERTACHQLKLLVGVV